jgi:5-oxoprolinase (ATP-hydrolysing) subunit A
MRVDINCDMGEGIGRDEQLMPFIDSANIACGYHAGDIATMQHTIDLCREHKVSVGAHPSFLDKENFGRKEMQLPPEDLYELIIQQLIIINELTEQSSLPLIHVKPHGALYNMSARDPLLANVIARAVKDFNKELVLFGLSGSHSIAEAKKIGLKSRSEVFADRTYRDDGSLTPRSVAGALIDDADKAVAQALEMVNEGTVTTTSGKKITILAETVCIHGDGEHAVEFARAIRQAIG